MLRRNGIFSSERSFWYLLAVCLNFSRITQQGWNRHTCTMWALWWTSSWLSWGSVCLRKYSSGYNNLYYQAYTI